MTDTDDRRINASNRSPEGRGRVANCNGNASNGFELSTETPEIMEICPCCKTMLFW